MTADEPPIYEPGDVVYGTDPYKSGETGRPWLVICNHEEKPFHGEQYIGFTLTTRRWMQGLVEIPDSAWVRGSTPNDSRIVPWAVQSFDRDDIDFWQGRLDEAIVEETIDSFVEYIRH